MTNFSRSVYACCQNGSFDRPNRLFSSVARREQNGRTGFGAEPLDAEAAVREEILDEIADLEEYARSGRRPPRCRGYRIQVNGEAFVVHDPEPVGREVLVLAGLTSPEGYTLRVKLAGQKPRRVELDDEVNLREPGVEKFKALPRDQTEG
jgi:hypothetical protein